MREYETLSNFEEPTMASYTIFSIKSITKRDLNEVRRFDKGHIYFTVPTCALECRLLIRSNQQDKNALNNLSLNSIHQDYDTTTSHQFEETTENDCLNLERILSEKIRFYYRQLDLKNGNATNAKFVPKVNMLKCLLGFKKEPFSIFDFNYNSDTMGCILTFTIIMESEKLFSKSNDLIYELGFQGNGCKLRLRRGEGVAEPFLFTHYLGVV